MPPLNIINNSWLCCSLEKRKKLFRKESAERAACFFSSMNWTLSCDSGMSGSVGK